MEAQDTTQQEVTPSTETLVAEVSPSTDAPQTDETAASAHATEQNAPAQVLEEAPAPSEPQAEAPQPEGQVVEVAAAETPSVPAAMTDTATPSVETVPAPDSAAPSSNDGIRVNAMDESAASFSWQDAEDAVENVMKTWKVDETWKHCVNQLQRSENTFVLEAIWSIPTRRRPIPSATASVKFTVQVQDKQPKITYTLEGQQLVHKSSDVFHEKWLRDLLEWKRLLQEQTANIVPIDDPTTRRPSAQLM